MEKIFSPLRILCLWILLSWLTAGCADASQPTPETISKQLVDLLAKTYSGSTITQVPRTLEDIRQIIRVHLGSKLLDAQPVIAGTQYSFVSGPDQEAQVNLLNLAYPNHDMVTHATAQLSARKGYFRNAIVLTRFSYTTIGNHQLIILFTEQAGDEKLVELIDSFAKQTLSR